MIASQGGETSITWGRNVQGAKRLGGESSRGRTDEGAKRPVTPENVAGGCKYHLVSVEQHCHCEQLSVEQITN